MGTGAPTPRSDVDVLIVGDVSFGEVVDHLTPAQDYLARGVNPVVYSPAEFAATMATGQPFVTSVLRGPKLFLVGSEHELARMAEKRLAPRAP